MLDWPKRGEIVNFGPLIEAIGQHFPDVEAVYLFGSHASGDAAPESDADIALLFPPGSPTKAVSSLDACRQVLEQIACVSVDLIDLGAANTVFQHEIVQQGRILFDRGNGDVERFEMLVMSLYQKLNEERSEILDDIYRNGTILAP
jgi:predicted nucleotidyltransferase